MISLHTQTRNMKVSKTSLYSICLLMTFVLASCNTGSGNTGQEVAKTYSLEGQEWKSKIRTHFSNEIHYRATEVPVAYYILKNSENTGVKIDSLIQENSDERIIEFEFEHFDKLDLLQEKYSSLSYDKAVQYMAATIKEDYRVVTSSKDTIACTGVHFERHFKVSPFNRVLLYFDGIDPEESIQLIYQDNLFNNGIFKFKFDETPLKM